MAVGRVISGTWWFVAAIGLALSSSPVEGGWSVGVSVCSSENPTPREWEKIIAILVLGDDAQAVASADANVCIKADGDVMRVLREIHETPNPEIEGRKERVARVFSGVRKDGAVDVALEIVNDKTTPVSHPLVKSSARAVVRRGSPPDISAIFGRLEALGDPPPPEGMAGWEAEALLDALSENAGPVMREYLSGRLNDPLPCVRLGALCGLSGLLEDGDREVLSKMAKEDSNPTVKLAASALVEKLTDPPED